MDGPGFTMQVTFANGTLINQIDATAQLPLISFRKVRQIDHHNLFDESHENLFVMLDLVTDMGLLSGHFSDGADAPTTCKILCFEEGKEEFDNGQDPFFAHGALVTKRIQLREQFSTPVIQVGNAKVVLGFEMTVQGSLSNPRLRDDFVDSGEVVSLVVKEAGGRSENMQFGIFFLHVNTDKSV